MLASAAGRTTARRSARLNKSMAGSNRKGRHLIDPSNDQVLDEVDYEDKLHAFHVCHLHFCTL